jgi:integrase
MSAAIPSHSLHTTQQHILGCSIVEPSPRSRLFLKLSEEIDFVHYSPRTQRAYMCWIARFLDFVQGADRSNLNTLTSEDTHEFMRHWARKHRMSVSTQSQAEAALTALYRHLSCDKNRAGSPGEQTASIDAHRVLTYAEVNRLLESMSGVPHLMASLLYGCGLRLLECARLRVQDVDVEAGKLFVRLDKSGAKRSVSLPHSLFEAVRCQMELASSVHQKDLNSGMSGTLIPPLQPAWLFPARRLSVDSRTGVRSRHHLHETVLQKAIQEAARACGLAGRATCQALRRAHVNHLRSVPGSTPRN